MPWIPPHKRRGRKVRGHYRTPPWVNTVLFIALVLFIAYAFSGK
jgi:hypothetical protein